MIFDTDVIFWALRGHKRAARVIDQAETLALSVVSYMELLQGARDKTELRAVKAFLLDLGFEILPLTENTGHRAAIYVEEYALGSHLRVADALIAATAAETAAVLCTGNARDYRVVKDIQVQAFRP